MRTTNEPVDFLIERLGMIPHATDLHPDTPCLASQN